jgi:hypothetical protein
MQALESKKGLDRSNYLNPIILYPKQQMDADASENHIMAKPPKNHVKTRYADAIERIKIALEATDASDKRISALYESDVLDYIAQTSRPIYQRLKQRLESIHGFDLESFERLLADHTVPEFSLIHEDGSAFNWSAYLEYKLTTIKTSIRFRMKRLGHNIDATKYYSERISDLEIEREQLATTLLDLIDIRDKLTMQTRQLKRGVR